MDEATNNETRANPEEEEIKYVDDNLNYVENLFAQLRAREQKLPMQSKQRLGEFKGNWRAFLEGNVDFQDHGDLPNVPVAVACADEAVARPKKSTGAISKNIANTNAFAAAVDLSDEQSTSHDSDNKSMSSSTDEIILKKKTKLKPIAATANTTADTGVLPANKDGNSVDLFGRLDMRAMPPIKKFDEVSGQSLVQYFERFECFCRSNYRGNADSWSDLLESNLTGKTLDAYKSLYSDQDSYMTIKRRLLEWYSDMTDLRKEKSKLDFKNARWKEGESLNLFANRVARLYRLAYPGRQINHSKTLREKYVNAAPREFQKLMKAEILSNAVRGDLTSWRTIQTYARHYDLQKAKEKMTTHSDEECVNFSKPRAKMRDVSTQSAEVNDKQVPDFPRRSSVFVRNGRAPRSPPWFANLKRADNVRSDKQCEYCGRLGHTEGQCRAKLKLCFSCGSNQHFRSQCPDYRQRQGKYYMPRSASQPAFRPISNVDQGNRRLSSTAPVIEDCPQNKELRNGTKVIMPQSHLSSMHDGSTLNHPAPTQNW